MDDYEKIDTERKSWYGKVCMKCGKIHSNPLVDCDSIMDSGE